MEQHLRVTAKIDLGAVRHNMESMHRNLASGQVRMTAVVKTDAYGHGALPIAKEIEDLDYLWGFAVATLEEAVELREGGITKPILILGYVFPDGYETMIRLHIRTAVFREDMLELMSAAAERCGEPALIHIAVDTGMSRIGITPDEKGLAFAVKAMNTPGIEIEGIFTHFARADEESGKNATQLQFEKFTGLIRRIEEMTGRKIPLRHCANSAAIIDYPEMHLDMVRAGITTYGLWPSDEVTKERLDLKPVMSLFSHITFIKDVPAGTPVSYGGTYVTEKTMRIATVPVGYGDGYPRSLSNKGYVLIRGKKAPIIGRVCMDQLMVCVDEIPEAMEGDLVTLLGRDGAEEITAEMLGDLSGRFNYELTCNINQRVPRDYTLT